MPASHSVEHKKCVAVVYGASAQPAHVIAERLAAGFQERGFAVELRPLRRAAALDLKRFTAAILIAPVPLGGDEKDFQEFVGAHKDSLERVPVAFISMSFAGGGQEGSPEGAPPSDESREKSAQFVTETQTAVDRLFAETGWRPTRHWPIAGAITYMRYNFVVRLILKLLSSGNIAQSRRRDDWRALDAFLDEFEREIHAAVARSPIVTRPGNDV